MCIHTYAHLCIYTYTDAHLYIDSPIQRCKDVYMHICGLKDLIGGKL